MNMHTTGIAATPWTPAQAGDIEQFIIAATSGSGPIPIEWADPNAPPPAWPEDADADTFGMSEGNLAKWGIVLSEKDTVAMTVSPNEAATAARKEYRATLDDAEQVVDDDDSGTLDPDEIPWSYTRKLVTR